MHGGGGFRAVVVWSLDRFGRTLPQIVLNVYELVGLRSEFTSIKRAIDLSILDGRLTLEWDLITSQGRTGHHPDQGYGARLPSEGGGPGCRRQIAHGSALNCDSATGGPARGSGADDRTLRLRCSLIQGSAVLKRNTRLLCKSAGHSLRLIARPASGRATAGAPRARAPGSRRSGRRPRR